MDRSLWRGLTFGVLVAAIAQFGASPVARAQPADAVFDQKSVVMIIGYAAGGGVDATGRLVAQFLTKHLPGNPPIVVRNMPGADGRIALNSFVRQVKPDGLTLTVGSSTQLDPVHYRSASAQYDPTAFHFIGGISRGGGFLVASKEGARRLADPAAEPVPMGAVDGTRSSEQMVSWGHEFLGWNVRWVTGYRGAADTTQALERGEVDMVSTSNAFLIKRLVESGKFTLLAQSGEVFDGKLRRRSDFTDVPVFSELIAGRIQDAAARDAYAYWASICVMDPWAALPPETPAAFVVAYRAAFAKLRDDEDFFQKGKRISEDLGVMTPLDVETLVKTAADRLTPEAESFLRAMHTKQGLRREQ